MSVYASDGRFNFMAPVRLPDAAVVWTYDVAVDPDGGFAVAALGGVGDIRDITKAGIVLLDGQGIQTGSVDTGAFRTTHLATTGDGSIWALGYQPRGVAGDYNVLRQYSRQGALLASYLPRSMFPRGLDPAGSGASGHVLASGDRIALVLLSGMTGSEREVIELDLKGSVLGRMRIDGDLSRSFALTSDGNLYGWTAARNPDAATLKLFNPKAGTATEVEHLAPTSSLLGADGANLVYRVPGGEGAVKEAWYAQPPSATNTPAR
jgi:hypothetical protein